MTEQVTGIDLVEAQFHIASGDSLASLGLGNQSAIGAPRGYAIQARVVAQGTGEINAYKEPSGVGVRVDACGYLGYTPPPQFDPLLAKLICTSGSLHSRQATGTGSAYTSTIKRTLNALDEFHIGGLQTNLAQLHAILSQPQFQAGDARTTLFDEVQQLRRATPCRSWTNKPSASTDAR